MEEGVLAAMIANIARTKGMPVGPLAVTNEICLTLGLHVMESETRLNENEDPERNYKLTKMMAEEFGRKGKERKNELDSTSIRKAERNPSEVPVVLEEAASLM